MAAHATMTNTDSPDIAYTMVTMIRSNDPTPESIDRVLAVASVSDQCDGQQHAVQDGRQYHGGPRRLQRVRQERGFIDVAREERGTQLGDTHRQEQGRRHVRGHAGPWDETPDERNERQEHDFQQLRNEEPDRGPELRYHIAAQIRVATVRRAMLAVERKRTARRR